MKEEDFKEFIEQTKKTMRVVDFLNDIEFINEGTHPVPIVIQYKNNKYFLKFDSDELDAGIDSYYTKSGIDIRDRIDLYRIFEDEIIVWYYHVDDMEDFLKKYNLIVKKKI